MYVCMCRGTFLVLSITLTSCLYLCVCIYFVVVVVPCDSQSHRPKGLIDLKECMLYPVHPSLYGRSVSAFYLCVTFLLTLLSKVIFILCLFLS